jgi:septal ring factor EnvC (AmiA/AmiB activator)
MYVYAYLEREIERQREREDRERERTERERDREREREEAGHTTDLPEPEGPKKAACVPAGMVNDTFFFIFF